MLLLLKVIGKRIHCPFSEFCGFTCNPFTIRDFSILKPTKVLIVTSVATPLTRKADNKSFETNVPWQQLSRRAVGWNFLQRFFMRRYHCYQCYTLMQITFKSAQDDVTSTCFLIGSVASFRPISFPGSSIEFLVCFGWTPWRLVGFCNLHVLQRFFLLQLWATWPDWRQP